MEKLKKRGVFFSIDALIALVIIFMVILVAYPVSQYRNQQSQLHYDLINTLSALTIEDMQLDPVVSQLITDGKIKNLDKSILQTIAELAVMDRPSSIILAGAALDSVETNENIGLWVDNVLIWSKNLTAFVEGNLREIDTTRQIISGVQEGKNVTGFSARAFLSSSLRSQYYYFGGYVGDGNISSIIEYDGNISSLTLELTINNDFELFANGVSLGNFQKSTSQTIPVSYIIEGSALQSLKSGSNLIEIKGDKLSISGGFIKITYDANVEYQQPTKYYFPGIKGLINIYDGLYIPKEPSYLSVFLHLDTNGTEVFLNIGNTTLYKNSTSGEENITITDSEISSLLDYSSLNQKTTPLRLGLTNASYVINKTIDADVFSVTDLSGSMRTTCTNSNYHCCKKTKNKCSSQKTCTYCGGTFEDKIGGAKTANRVFIDEVLNRSTNRIGLVGYETTERTDAFHQLSKDNASLNEKIDSWTIENGMTCICCGINNATTELVANSPETNFRSMVVMSDGNANRECSEQGTGNAKDDAIEAACDAYNNYGMIVYSVGFGSDVDEKTLQAIADCGGGAYYYSNVTGLSEIYKQIAEKIRDATYYEQTVSSNSSLATILYPDSYIKFIYPSNQTNQGLLITAETQFNNPASGTFSIPENSLIIDATAISYSGSRWTTKAILNNNNTFYNIDNYNLNYIELGDPYAINIPLSTIMKDNTINITTGVGSTNSSSGSQSNKIIYTISKNVTAYSEILIKADGCLWNIQFADYTNITNTPIPDSYQGTEVCHYNEAEGKAWNSNDAYQVATIELLKKLDLNDNNKIDIKFREQDLQIGTSQLVGIPFAWQTEIQARTWR